MRQTSKPKLKRELSFIKLTLTGVGIIFGAGIYALIGKVAGHAGYMIWLSFLISAIIAAFTGLSYAELSSMYPEASAEYIYTKKALKKMVAFVTSILVIFALILSTAAVSFGFAGYFISLFNLSISPILPAALLIIATFIIITIGIKETAWTGIIFAIIEAAGLIFIITVGLPHVGEIDLMQMPKDGFSGIITAVLLIFFAYIGFEDMAKLAEETKNPKKTVPLSIVAAIIIITIVYVLVSIAAVSVLDPWTLHESNSPLADVAASAVGNKSYIALSIIALFATANTVLFMLLAASRLTYGIAKEKIIPTVIAKVNKKTQTPIIASVIVAVLSIIFTFFGEIEVIANITDLLVFVIFVLINLSLIILRYKEKDTKRKFKVPLNIGRFPVLAFLGLIFNLFLITQFQSFVMISASILILITLIIYFILEFWKSASYKAAEKF